MTGRITGRKTRRTVGRTKTTGTQQATTAALLVHSPPETTIIRQKMRKVNLTQRNTKGSGWQWSNGTGNAVDGRRGLRERGACGNARDWPMRKDGQEVEACSNRVAETAPTR